MYDLYKKIYDTLGADVTLLKMIGSKSNIRRRFQREPVTSPLIVFHESVPSGPLVTGTTLIEDLTFEITVYAPTDREVAEVIRRVVDVLHDANLSSTSAYVYQCDWKSWLIGIVWDPDADAWRRDADFRIVVRRVA